MWLGGGGLDREGTLGAKMGLGKSELGWKGGGGDVQELCQY